MKAIKTTYLGPTDTRGSRIKASDTDGNSVTVPYPHEKPSGAQTHAVAACALVRKMGWDSNWRQAHNMALQAGGLKDCYVFVFAKRDVEDPDNFPFDYA